MSNALLVVDVQQYYLSSIPAELPKKIADHYQSVSYDHIVFAVFRNTSGSNFVRSLKWDKCSSANDATLPQELAALPGPVFERAYYSAFKNPELHRYLQSMGVERLVLCGVDSEACVLATAFEAFDLGYHLTVDFNLTYSTGDLDKSAQKIINRSLLSRD